MESKKPRKPRAKETKPRKPYKPRQPKIKPEPIPVQADPIPVQADPIPVQAEPIPKEPEPIPVQAEPIPKDGLDEQAIAAAAKRLAEEGVPKPPPKKHANVYITEELWTWTWDHCKSLGTPTSPSVLLEQMLVLYREHVTKAEKK